MIDVKAFYTPTCYWLQLISQGSTFPDPTLYRSTVGALQYLCITQPDINYAVNQVSQFMHSPTEAHWSSVKQILRYLKGTSSHGLFVQPSLNFQISAYSDADWASNIEDRKSIFGYCILVGRNLVSWGS